MNVALAADGPLPVSEILLRLVAAVVLGGVLGFEREWRSKPAGLRTHMMVALGAACFSLAALAFAHQAQQNTELVVQTIMDPTRVVQGVIGGIGFLGAGAIIRNREGVEGLTTAGSIWLVGAVGVAAGAGHFALAALAVLLAVIVLSVVGWLERRFVDPKPPQGPGDGL